MSRTHKTLGWALFVSLLAIVSVMGTSWLVGAKASKGTKNPNWLRCSTISDCTVAQGLCGDASGVNTKYLKSFDRWVARRQARIRCAGGIQSIGRAVLACENSLCVAGRAPESMSKVKLSFATKGTCNEISDCTVSRTVCGDPLGIPWYRRKKWEIKVHREEVAVDCACPVRSIKRAVLACENNHCVAGPVPSPSRSAQP